jgi:hypothetical protein
MGVCQSSTSSKVVVSSGGDDGMPPRESFKTKVIKKQTIGVGHDWRQCRDDPGTAYAQDHAKKTPKTFSIDRARVMIDMSTAVYMDGSWWASKKAGAGKCTCPEEWSLNLKWKLGELYRTGLVTKNYKFGFTTLPDEYNIVDGSARITNGVLIEPEGESEGMILVNEDAGYVVVSLRGTSSLTDALTDIKAWKIDDPTGGPGRTHSGNSKAYIKFQGALNKTVNALFAKNSQYKRLFVTGHSLGGALATLAAKGFAASCPGVPRLTCYTYGSPMVGNDDFVEDYNAKVPETYRMVNDQDVVPHCPPPWFG